MIIEFYGIPGCGKSTLSESLYKIISKKRSNKNVYYYSDILKEYNSKYRIKFCCCQKYIWLVICELLFLFFYINNKKALISLIILAIQLKSSFMYFIRSLEIMAIYQYIKKTHDNDIIIVDHGIIQNIISLVYMHKIKNTAKFLSRVINVIENNTYYVFIKTNPNISCKRIRNRQNQHGRLPIIENDVKLVEVLEYQYYLFFSICKSLKSINMVKYYEYTNNDYLFESIEKTSNSLYKKITKMKGEFICQTE